MAIFDVNMPQLSGIDLLRLMRKDTRLSDTPVLLMSSEKPSHLSFESFDTGVVVFVPKPFTRVVLAVGEPISIPASTPIAEIEEYRLQMQYATNALMAESKQLLASRKQSNE